MRSRQAQCPRCQVQHGQTGRDQIIPYDKKDLRKLAFWSATGSGKTLLMHVNICQYRHYLKLHGRERED